MQLIIFYYDWARQHALQLLIGGIGMLVLLRLASVPFTPPGFFVDEAATGAHVSTMLLQGTNAFGAAWPGYSEALGGGYTTPTYLYPLIGWAAVFGFSELSLRYFSQFITLCAIAIFATGLRFWFSKRYTLLATLIALSLPWGWLQGNIAWDPAAVPFFIATSFTTFSVLLFSTNTKARFINHCLLPVSLVGLAYVYPPSRVSAPLLFLLFYGILLFKKRIRVRTLLIICVFIYFII